MSCGCTATGATLEGRSLGEHHAGHMAGFSLLSAKRYPSATSSCATRRLRIRGDATSSSRDAPTFSLERDSPRRSTWPSRSSKTRELRFAIGEEVARPPRLAALIASDDLHLKSLDVSVLREKPGEDAALSATIADIEGSVHRRGDASGERRRALHRPCDAHRAPRATGTRNLDECARADRSHDASHCRSFVVAVRRSYARRDHRLRDDRGYALSPCCAQHHVPVRQCSARAPRTPRTRCGAIRQSANHAVTQCWCARDRSTGTLPLRSARPAHQREPTTKRGRRRNRPVRRTRRR